MIAKKNLGTPTWKTQRFWGMLLRFESGVIVLFISLGKIEVEGFGLDFSIGGSPHKLVPLCLITALAASFITRRNWLVGPNPLTRYIVVFALALSWSLLNSIDRYGTAKDIFKILMAVAFFDLLCQLYGRLEDLKSLKVLMIAGYVAMLSACVFELLEGSWRVSGPLRYPTILGGYLVMVLPLLLARMFFLKTQLARSLFLLLFVAGVLALLGTLSRGAYAGFFVALVLLTFITREKRLLVLVLIGLILVLPIVYEKVQTRLIASYADVFVLGQINRKNIWLGTMEMLKDQRVLLSGLGMGDSYGEHFVTIGERYSPGEDIEVAAHPHNMILFALISGGLIGLAGFLYLLWGIMMLLRLIVKNAATRRDRWIAGALIASFAGIAVQNMVDCTVMRRSLTMLVWLLLAGAVIQARRLGIVKVRKP